MCAILELRSSFRELRPARNGVERAGSDRMAELRPNHSFLARVVRFGFYPFMIAASFGTSYSWIAAGTSPGAITSAVGLGLIPVVMIVEHFFMEAPGWRVRRGEAIADLLHLVISNPVPIQVFTALFHGVIISLSATVAGFLGVGLWPNSWPLLVQVLFAVLIGDFVNYTVHRVYHETRLWPLHAVHHCSRKMYSLLAVRLHPVQNFLTFGSRITALWSLGAPEDVLALSSVLSSTNSYVQHSNIHLSTGFLRYVLATPELHRVHHSANFEEHNANYGNLLSVWDRLFGSYTEPVPNFSLHDSLGLPGVEVTQTYWSHLKLPFEWERIHRSQIG